MEIPVAHGVSSLRMERIGQNLGERAASLHRNRRRRLGKTRILAVGSAFQGLRPRAEWQRARLRQHSNPPPGHSGASLQSARPVRRTIAPPLRLLPRRADLRHAPARRHRARHRPRRDAPRRRKVDSRSHRFRQDHRRTGLDGGLAVRRRQRTARSTRDRDQGKMSRIRILPEAVANKIAAGEVVERPASVVKELLENAIDAGAKTIRVEVEVGGKRMIRVIDDGHGMTHDDALLAFERHATSKLKSADDLLSIATLGFRGEALPTIAAVSRLLLETRDEAEAEGTRIEFAGGKLMGVKPAGLPAGTTISVADIFYCVPARRKFLKSDTTELGHIASLVTHYALANPGKQFVLTTPTQEIINCSPAEKLADRVYQLFGRQALDELVEIPSVSSPFRAAITEPELEPSEEKASLTVSGFTSRPDIQRMNRNGIYIFVNWRLVRDRLILHAIHEAYRNILPPAVFPATLLFLEMPYDEVDVNVHPAKIEVRFRRSQFVHDFARD